MTGAPRGFAHSAAVEVYGAFLDECVIAHVAKDRVGAPARTANAIVDGRPVRLVTISGKGGWSPDSQLRERYSKNRNVSLLDHALSVARGALMFWLANAPRAWSGESDLKEIEQLGYSVVCIAFLHDIDKDLGLARGEKIPADAVAERMRRYGIDEFLAKHDIRMSPAAMLNYIEAVEGTQVAGSAPAPDFNARIASTCRYVELADKLDGTFSSNEPGGGVEGVVASLGDPNRWPVLGDDSALKRWERIEVHDHLHPFLLDGLQSALSSACEDLSGRLPLVEVVHGGRLLAVIPREQAGPIQDRALERFLQELPYGLGFSVNNRLACEFVGGAASWQACREVMDQTSNWRAFANLLALPKPFVREHRQAVDELFESAGMSSSWSSIDDGGGATAKPALNHPGGYPADLDMEPAHALTFLAIALNHRDSPRKGGAPDAASRERELTDLLEANGTPLPRFIAASLARDARARRVMLALWAVAEIWKQADDDPDSAQELLDLVVGRGGLAGLWIEGDEARPGLAAQVEDTSSEITSALRERFGAQLKGAAARPFDGDQPRKRCILCNEPVRESRRVRTESRAHGIKSSAFSGRDLRNDHLASPSGDTHLCLVCLAESQLRQDAQEEFKGSGDLPALMSSPTTTGLFGGLAFQSGGPGIPMGLNDLNRLSIKKGRVYEGLDCQKRRIRLARLEAQPRKDGELVAQLRMILQAVRRLGRPIHIFRGAPRQHPAIFHSDSLPTWLERLLGGDSLRIEQLGGAMAKLELFERMADMPGLGIEWAKQLADPDHLVRLGAICVAWSLAVDREGARNGKQARSNIEAKTREHALSLIRSTGGEPVNLKNNADPLIRLAWLATRIQKRRGFKDSTGKQLLCWKIAVDFYAGARASTTQDRTALILGLAGTLEEELTRKDDAAAKKHRDDELRKDRGASQGGESLADACVTFAEHFADNVWGAAFGSKEPTSQEQRRAASIYRFALLESYRERAIAESASAAFNDESPES